MSIIGWPDDVHMSDELRCAICGKLQSRVAMSAGMEDHGKEQRFACDIHLKIASIYILGWINFLISDNALKDPELEGEA